MKKQSSKSKPVDFNAPENFTEKIRCNNKAEVSAAAKKLSGMFPPKARVVMSFQRCPKNKRVVIVSARVKTAAEIAQELIKKQEAKKECDARTAAHEAKLAKLKKEGFVPVYAWLDDCGNGWACCESFTECLDQVKHLFEDCELDPDAPKKKAKGDSWKDLKPMVQITQFWMKKSELKLLEDL